MPENGRADLGTLSDLRTPWCLRVAATLRIADLIAEGKDQIDTLAAETGCDGYALHRVMTHLALKGVFEEPAPGRFALNEPATELLNPSGRIGLDLEGIGGRLAQAWDTLLVYVQTGEPAYQEKFGLPFWEDLDAHPNLAESFDDLIGPAGHGFPDPEFQITGGWGQVHSLVDVGGGTGAMLAQILRLRPEIYGTLVELPRTAALSWELFRSAGVEGRVTIAGQSFFDPLPPGGDIYLLRGILNDWPDREARLILSRCAEAARPNGRVVVLKSVASDEAPRPVTIEMVLLGGRQRSVSEIEQLAGQAGLEVVAARQQDSGLFVTECRPT
jgi:hypothetical protein